MIPDAGSQQQAEQGLRECYEDWINDPQAQREYRQWQLRTLHRDWLNDYDAAFDRNSTEQDANMPNIDQMIESKYLTKSDVGEPGDGTMVTIVGLKQANIARDDEEPKMKWLIKFKEFPKPMVLGSTTLQLAAMILGSKNTDDWIGKRIEVYHDPSITFGDKLVGGIRFRKRGKTNEAPLAKDGEVSDDVPF